MLRDCGSQGDEAAGTGQVGRSRAEPSATSLFEPIKCDHKIYIYFFSCMRSWKYRQHLRKPPPCCWPVYKQIAGFICKPRWRRGGNVLLGLAVGRRLGGGMFAAPPSGELPRVTSAALTVKHSVSGRALCSKIYESAPWIKAKPMHTLDRLMKLKDSCS